MRMAKISAANKYGARKIVLDGIAFDSKKEANRWAELRILERAGQIEDLRRQVEFVLIPAQYEDSTDVYQKGPNKGKPKRGKLLEHECAYIADFVYRVKETGRTAVEDTKGFRTKDYIIKRKLMLERYGIRIKEV